jgi:SAM-dependent methyltransferase
MCGLTVGSRADRASREDWEDVARFDPLWGVMSCPGTRNSGWDRDAFFDTGEVAIAKVIAGLDALSLPERRGRALDFGCGVGRLTRPLGNYFESVVGVDASPTMVEQARMLNADRANCEFHSLGGLASLPSSSFDLVHSQLVLQHLPGRAAIRDAITDFVRLLAPGGAAVFQLLTNVPPWRRIHLRHWAYRAGRALGANPRVLHHRLHLMPFTAIHLPSRDVDALLASGPASALRVDVEILQHSGIESRTYFVGKPSGGLQAA